MKHKNYKEQKKEFDDKVMLYLVNKLFTENIDTDSYKEGITDGNGNLLKDVTKSNSWALTSLDNFIFSLKDKLGESGINSMFGKYSWIGDLDPLYIINSKDKPNYNNLKEGYNKIISRMEDNNFLPDDVKRRDNDEFINNSNKAFRDRVSFAATNFTLLLYSLIDKELPNSVNFQFNVLPSVEIMWRVTPLDDYSECVNFLKDSNLIDTYNKITNKGIVLLVNISKLAIDNELLNSNLDRVENKYNIVKKLSEKK